MSDEIEKAIKNAASELASDPAHIPQIQWVMRKHLALVKSKLTQERDQRIHKLELDLNQASYELKELDGLKKQLANLSNAAAIVYGQIKILPLGDGTSKALIKAELDATKTLLEKGQQ
jgi:hypothetical protein